MILVDTSVWIDSLRGGPSKARLSSLIEDGDVLVHPWVIGELALGNLGRRRRAVLGDLSRLQPAPVVPDEEVVEMIDARRLAGSGIGWVDAQLVASSLASGSRMWTLDATLERIAKACRARDGRDQPR